MHMGVAHTTDTLNILGCKPIALPKLVSASVCLSGKTVRVLKDYRGT